MAEGTINIPEVAKDEDSFAQELEVGYSNSGFAGDGGAFKRQDARRGFSVAASQGSS